MESLQSGLRKEISQLRAVVFPLSPRMGFVEFVHKPNKKLSQIRH